MSEKQWHDGDDDGWVRVGSYPTLDQANDHGLVILAMGEACQVIESEPPGEFDLRADAHAVGGIADELDAYRREVSSLGMSAPSVRNWATHSSGGWLSALWVCVVVWVFMWQGRDAGLVERWSSSNLAMMDGHEWWRCFTALFLHADLSHLVGNLVGGVVMGTLVSKALGSLRGWGLILGCGTLGNAFTAWITYPQPFISIGASTAVFAGLGILSGLGIAEMLGQRERMSWMRIFAPLLGGIILLGWLGGGHELHTDVLGHVFGFGAGAAAGMAAMFFQRRSVAPDGRY
ncbi:MAG: rhomboid family intramembrane serine protease [Akkermansiaceae bacterium]|nr:rhomboid family intramembrane serine protease [Akkermansiaceae bacterium]